MAKPRPCGCKGIRTCLVCESEYGAEKRHFQIMKEDTSTFSFCPFCNKAFPGWEGADILTKHPNHEGNPIDFPGVLILVDFLSSKEADCLIKGIDEMAWDTSQSGRRKQNFGPKCNFKKKKLAIGNFNGFPKFSQFVQNKLSTVPLLGDFQTIEQCSLEYCPERGASIDPHIDDCWIWGERIVTVNVLGDSVLTMTNLNDKDKNRYNLDLAPNEYKTFTDIPNVVVRLPMPAKSLMVLYGAARYQWEHCVLRDDINNRRVCLAYREFTTPYLVRGEKHELSKNVLKAATNFWDHEKYKNSDTIHCN